MSGADHATGPYGEPQLPRNPGRDHGLARKQRFWRPVQGSNLCQEAPNTGEACCPHWWILSWGNHQKWKEAAVWSLTQRVAEVTEG